MAAPRPRYESAASLSAEHEFALLLGEKFNCTFAKMPIKYILDYAMVEDGMVTGFVELRCRSNPVLQYPTYMLALAKYVGAADLHRATGKPTTLMVRWTDAWGCVPIHEVNGIVSVGGRVDRGDWQDIEPVVLVPLSKFTIIRD